MRSTAPTAPRYGSIAPAAIRIGRTTRSLGLLKPAQDVDSYLDQATLWPDEISKVRTVLLRSGLTEAIKWGKPCYSHDGNNIVILQEMKDFLALMFFKGALLRDPSGILEDQGPNSRSARRVCIRSTSEVTKRTAAIRALIVEAIEVEAAGLQIKPLGEVVLVDELRQRLDGDAQLQKAFAALTPGRQREYNLHFSDAKKPETRAARIDKFVPQILSGKGLRDR